MTDELDALKAALKATPAPDPAAKAAALRLAAENFDRLQGSTDPLRPTPDRPQRAGLMMGVRNMLNAFKSKPLLTATTSAAALMIGFVVILPLAGKGPLQQATAPETPNPRSVPTKPPPQRPPPRRPQNAWPPPPGSWPTPRWMR